MPRSARSLALAGSRTSPTNWLAGFFFNRCSSVFLPTYPLAPVTSILPTTAPPSILVTSVPIDSDVWRTGLDTWHSPRWRYPRNVAAVDRDNQVLSGVINPNVYNHYRCYTSESIGSE